MPGDEREALLQFALRATGAGPWRWTLGSDELWTPAVTRSLLGFDDDVELRPFADWRHTLHDEDRARVGAALDAVRRDRHAAEIDYRIALPDGSTRAVSSRLRPELGPDGSVQHIVGLTIDVTERDRDAELRRTAEVARATSEELAAVLDAAPVVVWFAHDPECRVISGNRGAHELLRMPLGRNLSKSGPEPTELAHFRVFANGRELTPDELPLQRAARGEVIHDFEEQLVFENGDAIHLFGNAVPLRDRDGRVRGSVGAFVDITDRKRAELELQRRGELLRESVDALQEAERNKDQFLAVLGHELRSPLQAVRYATQVLLGLAREDPLPRLAGIIGRQTDQLVRLVEDLFDVSRIRLGKIELRREHIDARDFVQRAIETSRHQIDERRHELRVTLPSAPLPLYGDTARLAQSVSNLLNNAAKYSPDGSQIDLVVESDGAHCTVRVRDRGIGFDAAMKERLFRFFAQSEEASRYASGGLGVGLALAQALVHLHGGSLGASSPGPAQGSEFWFSLPLLAAGAGSTARGSESDGDGATRQVPQNVA